VGGWWVYVVCVLCLYVGVVGMGGFAHTHEASQRSSCFAFIY